MPKNLRQGGTRAGKLMTDRVPTVEAEATVGDVEKLLLEKTKQFESIYYVYVLDVAGALVGVISVKDVFREPKGMPVSRFMVTTMATVRPGTDEERVAYTALRHNIKAVPVVARDGKFLGVVLPDTILSTLYHEKTEDMFRFAGVSGAQQHHKNFDDILHLSLARSLLHRLPWLLVGLMGGVGIAYIVGAFESLLAEHLVLAAFVPLVVYMASATAAQTNAFVIRDLALGFRIRFTDYFIKEIKNDIAIATVTSVLLFLLLAVFGSGGGWIAVSVSLALFVAVVSSISTGLLVPYALSRMRLDPANGTGPLATILQDALSVSLYFFVASLFL